MGTDDHPPYETDEGGVCISRRQRRLHEGAGITSITVGTTYLLYLSTLKRPLTKKEKDGLIAFGMSALVIDAMLYTRLRRAKKRRRK